METTVKKYLGSGLYTVREAALYARVSEQKMRRWLFGTSERRAIIEPQFGSEEKLVSFLDLVQTLAIREISLQHAVPIPKFRQAIKWVKERYAVDFPFAREHYTYLFGKELVIEFQKGEYALASGKQQGQQLLQFVEMYLKDLTFNEEGLAKTYKIFTSRDGVVIKMNPAQRFGEPLLPSGYSAMGIWEAIKAEGGIENAAKAYDIPREEVTAAYLLVDHLGAAVA